MKRTRSDSARGDAFAPRTPVRGFARRPAARPLARETSGGPRRFPVYTQGLQRTCRSGHIRRGRSKRQVRKRPGVRSRAVVCAHGTASGTPPCGRPADPFSACCPGAFRRGCLNRSPTSAGSRPIAESLNFAGPNGSRSSSDSRRTNCLGRATRATRKPK